MRQTKQPVKANNFANHLNKNGGSHMMDQKRSFCINRSAKSTANARGTLGFGGTTADDSSNIHQDVSIEMEEGHFPPKVPADTRGKGKEEAANAHTRVSTRNSVLNLAKENGAISGGPHFQNDQKISKADPHQLNGGSKPGEPSEGAVGEATPRRANQRYSALRDQYKDVSPEEATTAGTKNQRLDKFFKYSLVKRKRDALQGGDDDLSNDNSVGGGEGFESGRDYEGDQSEDGESSEYDGTIAKKRKRKGKKKLGARGVTKKISKRGKGDQRKLQIGYFRKGGKKDAGDNGNSMPLDCLEQTRRMEEYMAMKKQERLISDGVSVFDLIMVWKNEIKKTELSEEQLKKRCLSRVVKCAKKKEQFVYTENLSKHIQNAQAILINPPWDCIKGSHNSGTGSKADANGRITVEQFCSNIKIPTDVMKDGLLFIWVEKEYISKIIKFFEEQEFFYVENLCYIMLDQNQKEVIDRTRQININDSFVKEQYSFLKKSKKTLLILRRTSNKKACCTLELRHQRTCDVCFDWAIVKDKAKDDPDMVKQLQRSLNFGQQKLTKEMQNTLNQSGTINNDGIVRNEMFKPNNYIYKLIETLLPKAMVDEGEVVRDGMETTQAQQTKDVDVKRLKLLELWGLDDEHRKGWVKIVQV